MKLRYGFGNGIQEVEVPDRNLIGEMICQFCPDGTGTASGNQLSILLKLPEWFDFKCRRQMICGMMNADICESRSRTIYGSVG